MLMLDVIEAVAPFDAQTVRIRGSVLSLHIEDFVVLDVVRQLAADAAIRANRIDFLVHDDFANRASGHQSSGGTCLDALPAGHASGITHRIVQIEYDLRVSTAESIADYVVDLLFPAGAHAAIALDTGVKMYRHGRM